MRWRFAGCVAVAVAALAGPALAHHSAAGIDRSKSAARRDRPSVRLDESSFMDGSG
jgi:hypothetical protein